MTHFVVYNDDYSDMGGEGITKFENTPGQPSSLNQALEFIGTRIRDTRGSRPRKLSDYTLIEGKEIPLETATVILCVKVKEA